MRRRNDIKALDEMIKLFDAQNIQITNDNGSDPSDDEKIRILRAMYISFYCENNNKDLVIGEFDQVNNSKKDDSLSFFAEKFQIVYGKELIFCAKNCNIISNIQ